MDVTNEINELETCRMKGKEKERFVGEKKKKLLVYGLHESVESKTESDSHPI